MNLCYSDLAKMIDNSLLHPTMTDADLALMRASCSEHVQVKAAGGVRDLDGLIRVRKLGGSRCGATATMLDEFRRREAAGELQAREMTSGKIGSGGSGRPMLSEHFHQAIL